MVMNWRRFMSAPFGRRPGRGLEEGRDYARADDLDRNIRAYRQPGGRLSVPMPSLTENEIAVDSTSLHPARPLQKTPTPHAG
jgi:hypothetical protein